MLLSVLPFAMQSGGLASPAALTQATMVTDSLESLVRP